MNADLLLITSRCIGKTKSCNYKFTSRYAKGFIFFILSVLFLNYLLIIKKNDNDCCQACVFFIQKEILFGSWLKQNKNKKIMIFFIHI